MSPQLATFFFIVLSIVYGSHECPVSIARKPIHHCEIQQWKVKQGTRRCRWWFSLLVLTSSKRMIKMEGTMNTIFRLTHGFWLPGQTLKKLSCSAGQGAYMVVPWSSRHVPANFLGTTGMAAPCAHVRGAQKSRHLQQQMVRDFGCHVHLHCCKWPCLLWSPKDLRVCGACDWGTCWLQCAMYVEPDFEMSTQATRNRAGLTCSLTCYARFLTCSSTDPTWQACKPSIKQPRRSSHPW